MHAAVRLIQRCPESRIRSLVELGQKFLAGYRMDEVGQAVYYSSLNGAKLVAMH
jgi:hypothetical protein